MPLLKNWASVPQFWKKYVGVMACVDGPTARWTLPIGRLQISLLPVHVIYTQNRCRFTRNQVNNYSHCEEVQDDAHFSVPVSISNFLSKEASCSYMPLSFHDFLCNFDLGMVFMPHNHWDLLWVHWLGTILWVNLIYKGQRGCGDGGHHPLLLAHSVPMDTTFKR